jgi:hypothetical protein
MLFNIILQLGAIKWALLAELKESLDHILFYVDMASNFTIWTKN